MSHIIEYYTKIQDGEILVPDSVKRQYEVLAHNAEHPGKYHLDLDIAARHIDFIEKFNKTFAPYMLPKDWLQPIMIGNANGFVRFTTKTADDPHDHNSELC